MGLMNKLRDSMPWVLAGLAGVFFLTIIFDWGAQGTAFQGSRPDPTTVATVNGEKITFAEYNSTVEMMRQQKLQQTGKTDLTEAELEEVQTQAWDQVVGRALIKEQAREMGITVSDGEIRDMMFYNPPMDLRQQFTDSTGQFRQDVYWQALRDPKNDTIVRNMEQQFREQLVLQKWQGLMSSSIIVPTTELQRRFRNENDKVQIRLVTINPTGAPQDFIKQVTDAQVEKYYEEHKNRYKAEEQRKVKFTIFSTAATGRDSAMAREGAESVRRQLASAPLAGIDSFAQELARDMGVQASKTEPVPPMIWASNPEFATANPGDAIIVNTPPGPQGQGGLAITKIVSIVDTGKASFHTRHILIKHGPGPNQENRDSAKAIADRIFNELKGGKKFEELALQYSQDGSARSGGDLGWVQQGQFVPEFEKVALNAPLNQVQAPIASQFGWHIIEVLGRQKKTINGVSVPYAVKSSGNTAKLVRQQANVFKNRAEEEGFDQAAKALGKEVIADVPPLQKNGQPLFGSRSFVEQVFAAEQGDVMDPVTVPNAQIIAVAQVTEIIPKGFKKIDDVRETIKSEIARKLRVESAKARAEQIRNAIQNNDLASVTAIDPSLRVDTGNVSPAEALPGAGPDYAVNLVAFKQNVGEISRPIKGENAYYIVQTVGKTINGDAAFKAKQNELRQTILREKQGRFIMSYIEELKEKAEIKDYRGGQ
jgi:peptidyl-prolyl cis-trans isomerase D